MQLMACTTPPTAPDDVRFVLPDGTKIPVECHYDGTSDSGFTQWTATVPQGVILTTGTFLDVGSLPPKHAIVVAFSS